MEDRYVDRGLSETEAATFLGLARQSLANMRCRRLGPPYYKLGARVIYRMADLEVFLVAHRITPGQEAP
jgi:hypothetical protein